jgi:hypothetical protein
VTGSLPPKDIFDYLIAITPILISAFVAAVFWWQYKISRNKLRLDLYNRRFEIYSKTLDFYQALISFDPSVTLKEPFNTLQKAFIKAYRESQFLFDEETGIYAILDQMHSKSFEILAAKEHGKDLASAHPQEFLKMHNQSMENLKWLAGAVPRLEKAMARYLNFHKTTT